MLAVIVSHGQPGDPGPQQSAIEDLAAKVMAERPAVRVLGATLAMPGALEAACNGATVVFPMFMAEGWFTRSELPRRLRAARADAARILPPFGADPSLPGLITQRAETAARAQGWDPMQTTLLLSAHGSQRSMASFTITQRIAEQVAPHFKTVVTGFVEQEPRIAEAAAGLDQAISLPLFALYAEHVEIDLPEALDAAGFSGVRLAPIGLAPEVPAMIASAINRASRLGRR